MKKTTVKNKRKLQQEQEPINFLEELKRLDKELGEGKKGIMPMFITIHEATKILVKQKLKEENEKKDPWRGLKESKSRELQQEFTYNSDNNNDDSNNNRQEAKHGNKKIKFREL